MLVVGKYRRWKTVETLPLSNPGFGVTINNDVFMADKESGEIKKWSNKSKKWYGVAQNIGFPDIGASVDLDQRLLKWCVKIEYENAGKKLLILTSDN